MPNQQKGTNVTWLLVIIIFILAVGIIFLLWYFLVKSKQPTPQITPTQVSATTPAISPKTTPSSIKTTIPSANDAELLMTLCQEKNPGMTCEVTKVDGNYAYGTAGGSGGGAVWYAKKTGGDWTIVIPGVQDSPSCADTADFPKTIVPICQ